MGYDRTVQVHKGRVHIWLDAKIAVLFFHPHQTICQLVSMVNECASNFGLVSGIH